MHMRFNREDAPKAFFHKPRNNGAPWNITFACERGFIPTKQEFSPAGIHFPILHMEIGHPRIHFLKKIASNIDTNIILMVATICASYAFMLPIATPPNAIAMSSKVLSIKYMASYGIIFNILGVLLTTAIAVVWW